MTASMLDAALVVSQEVWIWTGIVLGVAAGLLGAYAGWRRAGRAGQGSPRVWVAAATLALALGLGVVVFRIRLDQGHRLLLLLPVLLLAYWFIWQVKAIRAARVSEPGGNQGRCQRK